MTLETHFPPHAVISQVPGNIVSDMAGEKVMLSVQKGNYYNLGEVGGRIWELINKPQTAEAIVDHLLEEYAVERSVCQAQVQLFLEQLVRQQLITIDSASVQNMG
ncbi:lasso peptide biosynthesis PqqD family chaperone [Cohnella sp. 56]|uniref:lasso peptide biosynthesis PqqD family chaperone n=1 Tax=Cohnella sp. 56 TaxID=3113722 RepID=UPI0030E883C0